MNLMSWLDELRQDTRYSVRSLAATPTFTLIALVTLALGIGANALIFGLVNGVLLRPLPYPDAARLMQIYEVAPSFGRGAVSFLPAYRDDSTQFESIAGYVPNSRVMNTPAEPERVGVVLAERPLFRVLGVEAAVGRTFREDDPAGIAVVSADFARRHFGSEAAAIGRTISLEGPASEIIGVMPGRFRFPYATSRMPGTLATAPYEVWMVMDPPSNPRVRFDFAVGRLRQGATHVAAESEMNATARRLAAQYPDSYSGMGIVLVPLSEAIVGSIRPQLLVLMGVVLLVLLAACANVANLLLVRASTRTRELAVRTAIGAGRLRLIRQLLTESTIIALAGGGLGFAVVWWATPVILAIAGPRIPRASDIGVDWRVFAFLLAVSGLTGLVFGLVPAIVASRNNVQGALKGDAGLGRGRFPGRFRDGLAAAEVALAFVLVIGAGLLVREFLRLRQTETGMSTASVLTMHLAPNLTAADCYALVSQIKSLPGVRAAAFAQMLPLQSWGWTATFSIVGRPPFARDERPVVELRYVTPEYFNALGIAILRGRPFSDTDTADAPRVIIVNETLARRYFGGTNPVGQLTDRGLIIGVAGDVRQAGLDAAPLADVYYPIAQNVAQIRDLGMSLIVSAHVPPASVAGAVRESIRRTHPQFAIFGVKTMDEIVRDSLSNTTFYTSLVASFAALALALACAGIYGVLSYGVASRRKEFGIRLALGADRAGVQRLVLRHAATLVAVGLAIGLGGVIVSTRFLESLIVGASRLQPSTIGAAAGLLAIVALVACLVPARRASRVDPISALRQD
jgi:predicted permease